MSKCYIEKKNGRYEVVDAKYGNIQGEYQDEALAAVAAMKMGYVLVC